MDNSSIEISAGDFSLTSEETPGEQLIERLREQLKTAMRSAANAAARAEEAQRTLDLALKALMRL